MDELLMNYNDQITFSKTINYMNEIYNNKFSEVLLVIILHYSLQINNFYLQIL